MKARYAASGPAAFYAELFDMKLVAAVTDDDVPSTKEFCPHIHIFLAMRDGSCVAFFECPEEPPMGRDPNGHHLEISVRKVVPDDRIKRTVRDVALERPLQ